MKMSNHLEQGTYLLTRDGTLIETELHVPSTKYESLGIQHLSSTDGDFLYKMGLIDFDELVSIVLYCFLEYINGAKIIGITDYIKFRQYAELKYAKNAAEALDEFSMIKDAVTLYEIQEDYPDFNSLDSKYFGYLSEQFCKVSRYGDLLEFRIKSDNFDWNKTIIDECLLKHIDDVRTCKINILKESNGTCKSYFMNVGIYEILEDDKKVLSSKEYVRIQSSDRISYKECDV